MSTVAKSNPTRYPISFQTTDCLIVNRDEGQILLGRKPNNSRWCFLGGFVDPLKDKSLEQSNVRERIEEAGINLECSPPKYLFSHQVNDERYKDGDDKLMTAMFLSEFMFGIAQAGDDIAQVAWFDIDQIKKEYQKILVPKHRVLMEKVIAMGVI